MLVVADTGPLHYLVLVGTIEILPKLYQSVLIPDVVAKELRHAHTPSDVQAWINTPPDWLKIVPSASFTELLLPSLDDGERAAISLASALGAQLLLIDDRRGRTQATEMGFNVVGTLGILDSPQQMD